MEDRWERVRQIVREECERIEERILAMLEKHQVLSPSKSKVGFAEGKWTGISEMQLRVWADAYGAVNIEAELKKAAAWIMGNPQLAPKSLFGRFLNAWFARQQNLTSIRSIPTKNSLPKEKICAWCGVPSTGSTNGNEHCPMHANKALYDDPPRKTA